jgi:Fe-S oxidoreductase
MRVHQAVSFLRPMMRIPRADAVFFPGCALLGYDSALLQRLMALLRREEPGLALAAGCCGQPTRFLEPARLAGRAGKLRGLLVQNNVMRIYTACPNCARELTALDCARVIPVWETLDRVATPEDFANQEKRAFALHDPCPVRQDRAQQDAVRALLQKANVAGVEFPRNRENTACCGNLAMLRATDPPKSAAMRAGRLGEIPPDLPVTSYCAGCVDAFRGEGRDSSHVVELLFGGSKSRGWANRIRNTILSGKD